MRKVWAIVYVGELSRCACPGVSGEFIRDVPARLAEDGYEPGPGEPHLSREEAQSLVGQHHGESFRVEHDNEGRPIFAKIVTEPFRLIRIRVRD